MICTKCTSEKLPVLRTAAIVAVPALASLLGIVWFRRRKNQNIVTSDKALKLIDLGRQSVDCDVLNQSSRCNETENLVSHVVASDEQFLTPDDPILKNGIIASSASFPSCDQCVIVSSTSADCDSSTSSIAATNQEYLVDCDESVLSCDIRSQRSIVNSDQPVSSFIATSPAGTLDCTSCLTTDQGNVVDSDQPVSSFITTSPAGTLDCTSCTITDQGNVVDYEQPVSSFITASPAGTLDCTSCTITDQGNVVDCDNATSPAGTLDCTSGTIAAPVMAQDSEHMPSFVANVHDLVMHRLSWGDDEGVVDEVVSTSTCLLSMATPLDSQTGDEVITSVDANVDMLSEDSGHGGSNDMVGVDSYQSLAYQFYFPLELCGMLIGKYGRHINGISRRSGAEISVREQLDVPYVQLVSIEGTESQINEAVHAIKQRFPTNLFPQISYENINESSISQVEPVHIQLTQMFLANDTAVDVIVSSVVAPDHIFVQQPNCDSFQFLQMQNCLMQSCYEQTTTNVPLPRPVLENTLCAAPMFGGWFRALVISYNSDSDECFIRFVDYGGYAQLAAHLLQQIRSDFTSLPFQAVECYLADIVAPIDNSCYPEEAKVLMEQLVRSQPLVAQIVGYADDGVATINLFSSFNDELYNVADELVASGVARKKEWPVESTSDCS